MRRTNAPQIHYQLQGEQVAEHQWLLDSAFDILFEEVLRTRSVEYLRVAPTDSTPTESP